MNKKPKKDLTKEIAEELDVFDTMLSSLVELLEEKGVLTQNEWEKKIESKIAKSQELTTYRKIQFKK